MLAIVTNNVGPALVINVGPIFCALPGILCTSGDTLPLYDSTVHDIAIGSRFTRLIIG